MMEVSSHALALGRVEGVDFDAAVFTNLTQDHLDFHKTMDAYAAAQGGKIVRVPRYQIVVEIVFEMRHHQRRTRSLRAKK